MYLTVNETINLGLINFTNSLPITYPLNKWNIQGLKISRSYPSMLNSLMSNGMLDVSAISAIEFIKNKNKYRLLDNICIASKGESKSTIIFSRKDLADIKRLGIPITSESTVMMAKIIFRELGCDISSIKFIKHKNDKPIEEMLNDFDAVLLIGDPALRANYSSVSAIKYDIGKLWNELFDLPAVFALWVANSAWANSNHEEFEWIKFIFDKAVDAGFNMYFNDILEEAAEITDIDKTYIDDYFKNKLIYKFDLEILEGLKFFEAKHQEIIKELYL